jgi:hypothetical protein
MSTLKRKRADTESSVKYDKDPNRGDKDADALWDRLRCLRNRGIPKDCQDWPFWVWVTMFTKPRPRGGDYFALPVSDDLVSPDVLMKANMIVDPRVRIVVRAPAELGKPNLLAVVFSESGDPGKDYHILPLLRVWRSVEEWHRRTGGGDNEDPLDEFMWKTSGQADMKYIAGR